MGTALPNHSYIDFSLVGSNSVQCHTDLPTCCSAAQGHHRGDWYFPNGVRLPFPSIEIAHVYQVRQSKVVKLRRSASMVTDGIYRCDIETSAARNDNGETVYAGLYVHGGDVAIQGNIQLRVESDLNGESPQFTLTCISTGGPATIVTWTRDSEEVSGGMTVLDNTVTAQYTHTLTVTGRLPGQYQCTVSNNKPSQDSASITVQAASAPTNLMAVQDGPTGIRVSWSPPIPLGHTGGYRIFYSGGSSGSVDINDGFTHEYLFSSLQNGTNYTVSIVGTSKHLSSILVRYPNRIALIPEKPSAVVTSTTATTIPLSWTASRGSLGSYELMWEREISRKCPVKDKGNISITSGSTSYSIAGLEEDSNYTITVMASNAAGSVVSDPITGMTEEAVPSAPPTSVSTSDMTFSSITVQWGAVDCIHQNGNITGYSVRYGVWRSGCTQTFNVSGGDATEVTITGLKNTTTYVIEVAAVNNAGTGEYSNPIVLTDGFLEGSTSQSDKGCTCAGQGAVAGYAVGGFVGGVLITAVLGAFILIVIVQSMRTKMRALTSQPPVPEDQKHSVPTSSNAAYGCVEGVRYTEREMFDMTSGAVEAMQGPVYETVPN